MKWIIHDLKEALAQLKRKETWLVITLLVGFGIVTYTILQFALKTDSVLMYLRHTASACRQLSNGPIIFLFCGMIFFVFSCAITFGEIQRYFHFKQRGGHYQASQSFRAAFFWLAVAIAISTAGLLFFNEYCR